MCRVPGRPPRNARTARGAGMARAPTRAHLVKTPPGQAGLDCAPCLVQMGAGSEIGGAGAFAGCPGAWMKLRGRGAMQEPGTARIGVIGLGYVGLPLAVAFAGTRPVVGFDTSAGRVAALRAGHDATREVCPAELAAAQGLSVTDEVAALAACSVYIVTVPTPIDAHKQPDLGPLLRASETVGRVLSPGDVVIYESTVYPGATEED